jgi:hypothetical protein
MIHTFNFSPGLPIPDGMTSNWATATVPTGDPTCTDCIESWALSGSFTVVGPGDTYSVANSPWWVCSGSWSLT